MSETFDALLPRIRQRDQEALAQYIEGNRWRIMAFIERQLGGALRRKVEPDDIFQETSADAVRALPEMDLADRDPFGWLCQIAERRIIDAHRKFIASQKRDAGREVSIHGAPDTSRGGLIDLLVASMTTASQAFSRDQKQIRLLAALDNLPTEQREALRLRYVDGLPSKDIAQRLGKTDGAVRVMLTRSLARLQQMLGVAEGNDE